MLPPRLLVLSMLTAVLAAGAVAVPQPAGAAVAVETPPLTTPWTSQVSSTNPLPEYPRPQLTRPDWQSLNGQWQFAGAADLSSPPVGQSLGETVLVPYPIESALSGVKRHENYMYYRRTFTVPDGWSGRRVQLNFGAVTWQARVWVNGQRVGGHTGGYDAFSFDITGALRRGSNSDINELIVGVYSPVDAAGIPLGKQRLNPSGIFYTAASGIWQTVWLEPTLPAHLTRLDTTPDVPSGVLDLVAHGAGGNPELRVRAEVVSGGQVVGSTEGALGEHVRVPVPNARLWSPDDPFLYDLRVSLVGTGGGDVVGGYFGMRSIGKAMVGGFLRPVINGRFIFQNGTLDQGYWPDGIYTAPTDEALKFDLQQQKNLGFNTVRKHIKIEPARWFYWADKLGLLVWQDMPAMRPDVTPSAADRANFESELHRIVDQLRGTTSIVQWVPFNEGWGEYDPARIADLVKTWDPTRLVDNHSGSNCCGFDGGNGDVIDDHIYVGPGTTSLPTATRAAVLGEFGGLGLRVAGHEWSPGNGFAYEMAPDAATLTRRVVEVTDTLQGLINARGLSGSIYTQPTDVENEVNGLWTYDRRVLKVDADQVRAANLAVQGAAGGLRPGTLVSLGATTACCTERYLRHQNGLGVTSPVSAGSDDVTRQDATYWLRPGLASADCNSFESRNYPGHYLRHSNYRIRSDRNDGTTLFAADSTFCLRTGHTAGGVSFESYNYPGRFLRHINAEVYIAANGGPNSWDSANSWAADTTWQVAPPWWRSGADLTLGAAQSLQVVTPGYTDRYLRHRDGLGYTDVVNADSDALLRADATFFVRRGLADPSCYSFEALNYPGHYLRHARFRIRKDPDDASPLFAADATFCAQPGRYGTGDVTLASYNIAAHNIRHFAAEVWIATAGGPKPVDAAASYDADTTWHIAPPPEPRQSHTAVVGVHNAFQKATFPYLADALDSGAGLIELDVWVDSATRYWRVNHELIGQDNNCTSGGLRTGNQNQGLAACLSNMRLWHDTHGGHRPIVVKVEFKNGFDSRVGMGPADFDRLVASKLGDAVYRPADLLGSLDRHPTLDAAAVADRWPTRSALAGKFVFEVIPGTFERQNPFDHLWTDTEYARYLRDLAAAGNIGSAQSFPAVLDAAAGDPRTRYPDQTIRPWFVFFDGTASSYLGGGIDPAWYDARRYQLIMTDAAAVAPSIHPTNPTPAQASARVAQLARAHASVVTADWSRLPAVLGTVLPRG